MLERSSTVRSFTFSAAAVWSCVVLKILFCDAISFSVEEIASPVELSKAYIASRPYKVPRRQDSVLHNNATKIAQKIANGFTTSRSRGRSALYRMARTSYAHTSSAHHEPPEEIASPVELSKAYIASRPYKVAPIVELVKAYMASRPYKVPRRQDLVLHNNATKIAPKIANGFTTPRSRGRSALYRMARTSYAHTSSAHHEPPVKLPAEPPHKKRAFRTSVPGTKTPL
nr:hypothetical protein [Tanacetum cinerariifolium]